MVHMYHFVNKSVFIELKLIIKLIFKIQKYHVDFKKLPHSFFPPLDPTQINKNPIHLLLKHKMSLSQI
uniref:Putative ovule protein n=1 Tax=Solanum chacoense TaxID=4108 RepID=A0A0V0IGA8_SOLCH